MKKLFLCSEFYVVASHIFKNFVTDTSLRVLFIHTASETHVGEKTWVIKDHKAFTDAGFDVHYYTITGKSKPEIASAINDADIIYSTGGNTFHYLDQLQKTDSLDLFQNAVLTQNKIYMGGSAGSMITSPNVSIRFYSGNKYSNMKLDNFEAMNLVDFIIFPHCGRKDFNESYIKGQMPYAIENFGNNKIILLNDNQYVRVVDDMYQIIDQLR